MKGDLCLNEIVSISALLPVVIFDGAPYLIQLLLDLHDAVRLLWVLVSMLAWWFDHKQLLMRTHLVFDDVLFQLWHLDSCRLPSRPLALRVLLKKLIDNLGKELMSD